MLAISGYNQEGFLEDLWREEDFYVFCAGRYKLIHQEKFHTERHEGTASYQLIFVSNGQAVFDINGEKQILKRGEFVLYHPKEYQYYIYETKNRPEVYWVHFSCSTSNSLYKLLEVKGRKIFSISEIEPFSSLFENIIQELQLKEEYHVEREKLLMQELLLLLVRENGKPTSLRLGNEIIKKAIKEFHSNYHREISIKKLAQENGINYFQFIDTFSKYTGMPPKQYITQLRLKRATELLKTTDLQVGEIASLVGYDNPLYFSRIFTKYLHCSPSQFRKVN